MRSSVKPIPPVRHLLSTALLALGLLGSALAAPLCRAPANLIPNAGFEQGTFSPGGRPTGWEFESWLTTSQGTWDNTTAHRGRHSVRIDARTPDDALWRQSVDVPVNVPLFLGGWIKSDNIQRPNQPNSPGATVSVLGRWDQPPPTLGTTPWHAVGRSFVTDISPLLVSARLGFWGGIASGTAWYDDLVLVPRVADKPHPRWKILVLVYPQTDVVLPGANGVQQRLQGTSSPAELAQATAQAQRFVEQDIPALTSGQMLPTLTVRQSTQPLRTLTPRQVGSEAIGWWPSIADTLEPVDLRNYDSVIVVWEPRVRDVATGAAVSLDYGPVTPELGLGATYASIPIGHAGLNGHRNVFKQEWNHGVQVYYQSLQVLPQPQVVGNQGASQYVNCPTGQFYVWQDETDAQPIPNSIFHNTSGFLHDHLSGTVARVEAPQTCLGVGPQVWAWGGPVTHSGTAPVFTAAERVAALQDQVRALKTAGMLGPRPTHALQAQLQAARRMLQMPRASDRASGPLQAFTHHVQALVRNGQLLPQAGTLLIDAATAAIGCV